MTADTSKYCQRCGASFVCRAEDIANCHCSGVALTPEMLDYISGVYADCLCGKCLAEIASHEAPAS